MFWWLWIMKYLPFHSFPIASWDITSPSEGWFPWWICDQGGCERLGRTKQKSKGGKVTVMARNWLESRNGTLVQWKSKHVWALCKNFFEGLCTGFNFKISKVSCASCSLLFSYCTNCPGMPWPWPQFHRSTRRTVYRLPYHDHHRYASSTHLWLVFHQHLEVSSEMSPRSFTVGLDHDTCGRMGMCENQTGTT